MSLLCLFLPGPSTSTKKTPASRKIRFLTPGASWGSSDSVPHTPLDIVPTLQGGNTRGESSHLLKVTGCRSRNLSQALLPPQALLPQMSSANSQPQTSLTEHPRHAWYQTLQKRFWSPAKSRHPDRSPWAPAIPARLSPEYSGT